MPQIIVCSLAKIGEAGRIYHPAAMITVLGENAAAPRPESLAADGYLRLNFSDLAMLLPSRRNSQTEQIEQLLDFGRAWYKGNFSGGNSGDAADSGSKSDGQSAGSKSAEQVGMNSQIAHIAPLLIHCQFGVSRSPAAAFILACALRPDKSAQYWAETLRRSSPAAMPNPNIVALADTVMQRHGRMEAAIAAMQAPSAPAPAEPFMLEV